MISVGLHRLSEGGTARPWLFAGLLLLALLFLASIIGTFTLMGEPFLDDWRPEVPMGIRPDEKPAPPPNNNFVLLPLPNVEVGDRERDEMAPPPKQFGKAPAPIARDQNELADNFMAAQFGPMGRHLEPPTERTLRQQGNYRRFVEKRLGRRVQLPPVNNPCVVREYAHRRQPHKDDRDFAETLYWHPVLVLRDGKAQITFDLSDSVTRYEVLVLSHTIDGRLGANRAEITVTVPAKPSPAKGKASP